MYKLFSWGANYYNQCGVIGPKKIEIPTQIDTNIYQTVACGYHHTLAIDENGHLYAWGRNNHYQLGNNTRENQPIPVLIDDTHTWTKISAGLSHSAAIDSNNDLYLWGDNIYNSITNDPYNETPYIKTPLKIMEGIREISCGLSFTLFVTTLNNLYFLGQIRYSQYGVRGRKTHISGKLDDLILFRNQEPYFLVHDIQNIYASSNYFFIRDVTDRTWTMGYNHEGNLGLGPDRFSQQVTELTEIENLPKDYKNISTKGMFSFILDQDNETHMTGSNYFGQLGLNTDRNPLTKFQYNLLFPLDIDKISTGALHTIFIIENRLFGSGDNRFNQISSDNTLLQSTNFIPFDHPNEYTDIKSGMFHNIALQSV